jgi:hypothetical protein
MPRPSHSSRFYHPQNIGWGVQIMKLFVMKFSPLPCEVLNNGFKKWMITKGRNAECQGSRTSSFYLY